jgi:cytochrome c
MKKVFIILGISLALAACGGGEKAGSDKKETEAATAGDGAAAAKSGETLMANSDCNTCHNAQSKIIGPALVDIAKKYKESDVDMLADKIIKGGSGNWGTVPMTAHADLSLADAKEMVKYILSVK